jgi:regulator of RNase E activity RraB
MCKQQIVVIDIFQEDIIHYCGTWYGSHYEGLGHMFVDPQHISDDMESNDDDKNEHVNMGSWNLMGSKAWNKVISPWVPL